jgi:hypothetical protein
MHMAKILAPRGGEFAPERLNNADENTIRALLQAEAKKDLSDYFVFHYAENQNRLTYQ